MSDATRRRVRDAADDLEYVVNVRARSLRTARSGAVGLYVPDHTLSFRYYMDVAFGAVERAQESELLVTLMPTAFAARSGITEQLDGFLVIDPVDGDPVVERLLAGRRPVVTGEHVEEGAPAPFATVFGDHRAGMRTLLDHLWERGSRSPAVMVPGPEMAWGREMEQGYREWCAEHDVPVQLLIGWFDTSTDAVRRNLDELFARPVHPDAVIAAPEGMATVAADAIRDAGLEVGADVLVAAYVDTDAHAFTQPSITALDVLPREMGRRTMELLVQALDGSVHPGTTSELPMELIVRDSTARGLRSS